MMHLEKLKEQVRKDLYFQNLHKSYKFFDCVSKLIISKNASPEMLGMFSKIDMNVKVYVK